MSSSASPLIVTPGSIAVRNSSLVLGYGSVGFADALGQARQVDLGEALPAGAALDLGDPQQCAEGAQDRIGLVDRAVDGLAVLLYRAGPSAGALQALTQATQRRTEVMGDVAGYLAQAFHERLDPVEHSVELNRQPVDSSPARPPRPLDRSPRLSELRRVHQLHPPRQAQAEDEPTGEATRPSPPRPPSRRRRRLFKELLARMGVGADHEHGTVGQWRGLNEDRINLVRCAQ